MTDGLTDGRRRLQYHNHFFSKKLGDNYYSLFLEIVRTLNIVINLLIL